MARLIHGCALWLLVSACGEPASETAQPAVGNSPVDTKKIALLVGVQDYPAEVAAEFPRLHGPHNDVDLMADVLRDRFGFAAGSIRILRDEDATLAGIVTAFEHWLIAAAESDSEVLFYFSGHGSRVPDRSGREANGHDTTLVAYDSRLAGRRGEYDLSDDALHALLQALAERTSRITVIVDACHSGGAVRGEGLVARAAPDGRVAASPANWAAFWPASVPFLDDDDERRVNIDRHLVHLAACGPSQLAREWTPAHDEGPDGRPRCYGAFTYCWARSAVHAAPGTSYREVAEATRCLVGSRVPGQSVWYEGALQRELFGGAFKPLPAGWPAALQIDGRIRVEAGALIGLEVGMELDVMGLDGAALARARVDRLARAECWAGVISGADLLVAGRPYRVFERGPSSQRPPLRVATQDADLAALLADSPWAEVATVAPEYELAPDGHGMSLFTVEGLRVRSETSRSSSALATLLRKESHFRGLWALAESSRGPIQLEVSIVEPTEADLERRWELEEMEAAGVEAARNDREASVRAPWYATQEERNKGLLAMIEVVNRSTTPAHIAVLSLSEDRRVQPIFAVGGDQVLQPNSLQRFGLWIGIEDGWQLDRPVRERYLVIATAVRIDLSLMESGEAMRSSGARLPRELWRALQLGAMRGDEPVDDDGPWGVAAFDLLVRLEN